MAKKSTGKKGPTKPATDKKKGAKTQSGSTKKKPNKPDLGVDDLVLDDPH